MSMHADNTEKETCHQQKHRSHKPLIKMGSLLANFLSNNGVCVCVGLLNLISQCLLLRIPQKHPAASIVYLPRNS